MKLPWDKKYLKISFHVIFTIIVTYLLITGIYITVCIIKDIKNITLSILFLIKNILSLFSILIIAIGIAYLLDPIVDFFQNKYDSIIKQNDKFNVYLNNKFGLKKIRYIINMFFNNHKLDKIENKSKVIIKRRTAGTFLAYIISIITIFFTLYFLVSNIGGGSSRNSIGFIDNIIILINNIVNDTNTLVKLVESKLDNLNITDQFIQILDKTIISLQEFLYEFSNKIVSFLTSAGSGIVHFLISLVIAFYILRDKNYIKYVTRDLMDTFLPNKVNRIITNTFLDLHVVFSGYIRGQLTDAFILSIMIGIGLKLIHVEYAVVIAVITGLASLIPFVGGIVAFILAITCELLLGSYITAIKAAIVIIVIHEIDLIFVVPRVLGNRVHLSPPLVLLCLPIGGTLFGIPGMLFAVPVCAMFKIFLTKFIDRYKERKDIDKINQFEKKQNNFKTFIENINEIND